MGRGFFVDRGVAMRQPLADLSRKELELHLLAKACLETHNITKNVPFVDNVSHGLYKLP